MRRIVAEGFRIEFANGRYDLDRQEMKELGLTPQMLSDEKHQKRLEIAWRKQDRFESRLIAYAHSCPGKFYVETNLVTLARSAPEDLREFLAQAKRNDVLHQSLSLTLEEVRSRTEQAMEAAANVLSTQRTDLASVMTPSSPTKPVDTGSAQRPDESTAEEERRKRQRMAAAAAIAKWSGRSW